MNIDGTTLKTFFWFLRLSAGPHGLLCVLAILLFKLEKILGLFLIIKIRVIVLKKNFQIEIFWGHEVLKMYF